MKPTFKCGWHGRGGAVAPDLPGCDRGQPRRRAHGADDDRPARAVACSAHAEAPDRAILRTTPALLGLFSLTSLWVHDMQAARAFAPRAAAWYRKSYLTFSDAIAAVRREIWRHQEFLHVSDRRRDHQNSSTHLGPHDQRSRIRRMK